MDLEYLHQQRESLERGLRAANTQKAYAHDWLMFARFCEQIGRESLPASSETVALYLTDLLRSGRKVSTAVRRTSGISYQHRAHGHPTPVNDSIWSLLAGARRSLRQSVREMQPLTTDQVRQISGILREEGTAESIRNRAILILGFTSALRRANITALLLNDLTFRAQGVELKIRQGKTDQEGRGRTLGVSAGQHPDTDLAGCLRAWLAQRGTKEGPLFTTIRERELRHLAPAAVGRIVKAAVRLLNLDPTRYAGHSLRSSFITEAGLNGCSHLVIAQHTGHKRMDTLRKYFRPTDVWRANATQMLGL